MTTNLLVFDNGNLNFVQLDVNHVRLTRNEGVHCIPLIQVNQEKFCSSTFMVL